MGEGGEEKRKSGVITENQEWLVLMESTGKEGVGYIHSCGEEVIAKTVKFSIWDGPGPCSGRGDCETYTIPYCPRCECEPSSYGIPIKVSR